MSGGEGVQQTDESRAERRHGACHLAGNAATDRDQLYQWLRSRRAISAGCRRWSNWVPSEPTTFRAMPLRQLASGHTATCVPCPASDRDRQPGQVCRQDGQPGLIGPSCHEALLVGPEADGAAWCLQSTAGSGARGDRRQDPRTVLQVRSGSRSSPAGSKRAPQKPHKSGLERRSTQQSHGRNGTMRYTAARLLE